MKGISLLALAAILFGALPSFAQNATFKDAVKRVEAKLEPSTAKRGETVKWTLTLDVASGWHTYPTKQTVSDFSSYANRYRFPKSADIVFVGELREPKPGVHKEKEGDLLVLEGTVLIEHDLVISPNLKPGKYAIRIPVRISACNKETCLKPEEIMVEAVITVSDAPAVPVEAKYQKEVDGARSGAK